MGSAATLLSGSSLSSRVFQIFLIFAKLCYNKKEISSWEQGVTMNKLQERTLKAYQEHYDDLLRFALTILKDEYAAQEVVQDLCIKILERDDLFSKVSEDRIRSYFVRAIHRSCLNRIKAEKPTVAMPEDMENLLPYEDPDLLDVGLRELYDQLTENWPEDVR